MGNLLTKKNGAYDVYLSLRALADIALAQLCSSVATKSHVLDDDFTLNLGEHCQM